MSQLSLKKLGLKCYWPSVVGNFFFFFLSTKFFFGIFKDRDAKFCDNKEGNSERVRYISPSRPPR